ncbi:MAG: class I SAM-dependent methyltransferase [Gemmatimonadaceae bacterium]|nr:class I SAM-dependent methyltransferase [Gemmatimonadaceae bacterium]
MLDRRTTAMDSRRTECGTATGDVVIAAVPAGDERSFLQVLDPLTERSRRIWSAGDYDLVSTGFRDEARAFIERRAFTAGTEVLDAACGSGNLAIPAARTGARVTGIDLVPSLLDTASAWAQREGLAITLDEGSVEALPYDDARFDVVVSMFGVMFAARPEYVMSELTRVTHRGSTVALANWTRGGFVGRMLAMHAARVPAPHGVPSPLLWADEDTLREWFDARTWQLTTSSRTLTFRYPHSPSGTSALFQAAYGPTVRVMEALDVDARTTFAAELTDHWTQHARVVPLADGSVMTEVESEYLEIIAIRR